MDATIRQANAKDATAIADVHNRSRADAFRGHIADEVLADHTPLEQEWASYFDAPDGRVAVAEVDGHVVGFVYVIPADPGERTELHNLYLLPEAAGSGLAPKLMDAALDADEPVFLWVAEFNTRAQAFYRKHGFTFDGEQTHHAGDNVTLRRMVRG